MTIHQKDLRGEGVYLNLFTDHGFKVVFGEEENKPFLIKLINALLEGEEEIQDLTFLPTEQLGPSPDSRKSIYDLYCETVKVERIIVELQQARQKNFKDRLIYYSTWPVQSQGKQGEDWSFKINTVYSIGILDFKLNEDEHLVHSAELVDRKTLKTWSQALRYVTLETPKIPKDVKECSTEVQFWSWIFKNSYKLKNDHLEIPKFFKSFLKKCRLKSIHRFDENAYRKSLMDLAELKAVKEYAREEALKEGFQEGVEQGREQGHKEGLQEGKAQAQESFIAKLKAKGMSELEISDILEC